MKAKVFLFCLLALLHGVALAGIESDIPSTNRAILKTGDWVPSEAEAQKALVAVDTFLNNQTRDKTDIKTIRENMPKTRVQFIGTTHQGKKIIWCNFFPAPYKGQDFFPDWKRKKAEMYDGGAAFWNIEYDPDTGKCMSFRVNGIA